MNPEKVSELFHKINQIKLDKIQQQVTAQEIRERVSSYEKEHSQISQSLENQMERINKFVNQNLKGGCHRLYAGSESESRNSLKRKIAQQQQKTDECIRKARNRMHALIADYQQSTIKLMSQRKTDKENKTAALQRELYTIKRLQSHIIESQKERQSFQKTYYRELCSKLTGIIQKQHKQIAEIDQIEERLIQKCGHAEAALKSTVSQLATGISSRRKVIYKQLENLVAELEV